MNMSRLVNARATRIVTLVVALAAMATILTELFLRPAQKTVTVYFPVAVHLYKGSEVDVLGVRIGTVASVRPQGTQVRVVIHYDAARKIPASAAAVVDEPTLVADRVVELTPPYDGGPVLPNNAVIPLARTQVPLELDQLSANLVELAQALGPNGANAQGALARAVTVGADNLRGEGAAANTTMTQLSAMVGTLGDNRDALFATVRNLQQFTQMLAQHDAQTRAFTTDLAAVSRQLADESAAFSAALHNLGIALGEVSSFIRDNRSALAADVKSLASVTQILARERILLARIADMGAVGISNYPHMYTPSARTYNARFDNSMTDNPALFVCQLYESVGGSAQDCLDKLKPLKSIPLPSNSKQSGSKR